MRPVHAFSVPAADRCLDGHFPGRPIVPGAVLLDRALAAVAAELRLGAPVRLLRAKFLAPVLPEEQVSVLLGDRAGDTVAFACEVAGRRVLSAVARYRTVPEPWPA